MQHRIYGKTGLSTPVFTLGGMRFKHGWSGPYEVLPEDTLQNAYEVASHALKLGINHFETARDYGRGERIYGAILKQLKAPGETFAAFRQRILITTKIAPMPTYQKMRQCIDESLERMQVDKVDILSIHGINTEEKFQLTFQPNGCLQAIRDAMNEGLIDHLGFSTHGDLPLIMKTLQTDEFDLVHLHYYYFFQRNWPAVALAAQKKMGVFIISPNDKGGQLFHPSQKLVDLCHPLTPMNFNDRFLLSLPQVHTLSLGADAPEQIDSHLSSLVQDPLADRTQGSDFEALLKRMDRQLSGLGQELCTVCYDCLPCPEDIHIPELLRFHNLWKAYDMRQFINYRYNMLEKHGEWFPGRFGQACTECGDCLPRCPQHLPIPKMLKSLHAEFYNPN